MNRVIAEGVKVTKQEAEAAVTYIVYGHRTHGGPASQAVVWDTWAQAWLSGEDRSLGAAEKAREANGTRHEHPAVSSNWHAASAAMALAEENWEGAYYLAKRSSRALGGFPLAKGDDHRGMLPPAWWR